MERPRAHRRWISVTTPTSHPPNRRVHRWRRVLLRGLGVLITLLSLGAMGFAAWLAMGDDADPTARARAALGHEVVVTDTDGILRIEPADGGVDVGVAFLPGARIERGAYVATWAPIVERTGVHVFVPGVPLNLPVLGGDHVADVIGTHPELTTWVVGGHSMGGFAASESLANRIDDEVAGLLLWASGPGRDADLSAVDLPTLVVAGARDRIVPLDMVTRGLDELPEATELVVIEGMTHGQFGRYREVDDPDRRADEETLADLVAATVAFLGAILPS